MSKTSAKKETRKDVIKRVSLIFCEPTSFSFRDNLTVIDVTHQFLESILKGPRRFQDEDGISYVFGKFFEDIDEYEQGGWHDVKNGHTGLIDLRSAKRKVDNGYRTRSILNVYDKVVSNPNLMKKEYPEIKWIDDSTHPNFPTDFRPCHMHYHVNQKTDEVDSIIIDNGYFFHANFNSETSSSEKDSPSQNHIQNNKPKQSENILQGEKNVPSMQNGPISDNKSCVDELTHNQNMGRINLSLNENKDNNSSHGSYFEELSSDSIENDKLLNI